MSIQIKGQLNNIRISPRKVRLVAAAIKGLSAFDAKTKLVFITKRASHPMRKLLESVLASAQHNFRLEPESLYIENVIVNEGRKLRRARPKGFGSTSPIQKKTSRVMIVLADKTLA